MGLATADIHVKVDPEVKTGAEKVLKEIGITMSDLINMTLRRVVRERRVPFETADARVPRNMRIESRDEIIELLRASLANDDGTRYSFDEIKKGLAGRHGAKS